MIDSPMETSVLRFVATVRATIQKGLFSRPVDDLNQMRQAIIRVTEDLGANCYSVRQYYLEDSSKEVWLVLDTYRSFAPTLPLSEKEDLQNILYVFPNSAKYSDKPFTFGVNREKINLGYREYFVCHLEPGDDVKINKGIAAKAISAYGGMPCLAMAFAPYDLLMNRGPEFSEMSEENRQLYLRTFFIHPKTCTGCVIPPAATPSPSFPQ
jgi:hypothetical protein